MCVNATSCGACAPTPLSPLLLPSGLVVPGSQDYFVYAWQIVNALGLSTWTYQTSDMLYDSTPAIMTQDRYTSDDKNLYKLNSAHGFSIWTFVGRVEFVSQ